MILNLKNKKILISKITRIKQPFLEIEDFSGKIQIYSKKKLNIGDVILIYCKKKKTKKKIIIYFPIFIKLLIRNIFYINYNNYKKIFFFLKKFINNFFFFFSFINIDTNTLCKNKINSLSNVFKSYSFCKKKFLYLKISPELNIKKMLTFNYDRIYEINKCFRNEGISQVHNFEFLMLEYYIKNMKFNNSIYFLENFITLLIKSYSLQYINIKTIKIIFLIFKKKSLLELIKIFLRKKKINIINKNKLFLFLYYKNINFVKSFLISDLFFKFFDFFIKKKIILPTFIKTFPSYNSPLAKNFLLNFYYSKRFELYFINFEISNGYEELNDYYLQKNNLKKKNKDFLLYMKNVLNYTNGVGIGLERLIMIIINIYHINKINI